MAYSISLPDGTIVADIPDEITPEQAKARILKARPDLLASAKPSEDTSGLQAAAKAGWERLKGEAGLVAGKAGLMSLQEAEEYKRQKEAEAAKLFTPTQASWSESPWLKFRETLGGSLPYMAAPAAAGLAAMALPVTGAAAGVASALAAGATSAAQFTGSNLARQMETGKTLAEADATKAALAAIPQAALDTVAGRLIPGIGKLFGAAGVKITAESAEALAKQGMAKVLGDYTLKTGQAMGAEGLTEAAQQVFERLQAGLSLTDPQARQEYFDNFIGGAVLGGALAPAGRYMERSSLQNQAAQLEAERRARERLAQTPPPPAPPAAPAAEVPPAPPAPVAPAAPALEAPALEAPAAVPQLPAPDVQVPAEAAPVAGAPGELPPAGPAPVEAAGIAPVVEAAPVEQAPEVRPGALTETDIPTVGVPKNVVKWLRANVVGKTREEVQAMVDADPTLIQRKGAKAAALNEILAPVSAPFVEETNEEIAARLASAGPEQQAGQPAVEPSVGPSVPAVGVPEAPAGPEGVGPLDGAGVVPSEPDVGDRAVAESAEPVALTPPKRKRGRLQALAAPQEPAAPAPEPVVEEAAPAARTADQVFDEAKAVGAERMAMLDKRGREPRANSPRRAQYDALVEKERALKDEWAAMTGKPAPAPAPVAETLAEEDRAEEAEDIQAIDAAVQAYNTMEEPGPTATNLERTLFRRELLKHVHEIKKRAENKGVLPKVRKYAQQKLEEEIIPSDIDALKREVRFRTTEEQAAPQKAIPHSELEKIVEAVNKVLGGDTNVTILDSITDLDPSQEAGSRSGALKDGNVYLFRDGIPDGVEGQKTIFHELFHKGLRNLIKEGLYHDVLNRLYDNSQPIRKMANEWMSKHPGDVAKETEKYATPQEKARAARSLAVDEALAIVAEDSKMLTPSLTRQLGNWFAGIADMFGLRRLARWLRTAGVSPLQQFINDALQASVQGQAWGSANRETIRYRTTQDFKPAPNSFDELVASSEIGKGAPGPIKSAIKQVGTAFQTAEGVTFMDKFRTLTVDAAATMEGRLNRVWDGAVRNAKGMLNPMGLYRQAQDAGKLLQAWVYDGALVKDQLTGTWTTTAREGVPSLKQVMETIDAYAKSRGATFEQAYASLSKMFEAKRLDAFRQSNNAGETQIPLNKLSNASALSIDEQIDLGLQALNGDTQAQAILADLDKLRFALIDDMQAVGRLTAEEAQLWKDTSGYIPFDRIGEFESALKPKRRVGRGLAQLGTLPEIIGSRQYEVGNTIDNFVKLSGWMIQQTVRQDATLRTLRALERVGHAKFQGGNSKAADASKMVKTYINGQEAWFELPSRWDAMAFKDMAEPKGFFVRSFEQFANILRRTITSMPPFAIKQVAEDIQRAYVTSGVRTPSALIFPTIRNFISLAGAELMGKHHPLVQQFERMGIIGDYDFHNQNPADSVLANLGYRSRGKVGTLLHRLEGITRASDLAVRAAIHERTMVETQDAALAATRAREFINFRRRGASNAIPALTATIPFFNAYLQGMDVLYRAATGKGAAAGIPKAQAKRLFMSKVMTMAALAGVYAFMRSGDDDYEEASLQIRHGNWLLPGGVKIPVPAELAALFKVPVEMGLEYMRRQGTPEDMEASEAAITALRFAFEQYVGRVTPIPAAIKPVLEAMTNHSFFTGRALEGTYQQGIDPSKRTAGGTSELAKAIAGFTSQTFGEDYTISPIKIDNFLRGYFGSVAGTISMATDQLLNPDRLDRPLNKYWLLSTFMYDTKDDGRRVDEFYDTREKVSPKLATLNKLKTEDPDAAVEYLEKHEQELIMAQAVAQTLQQLSELRKYRNQLNGPVLAQELSKEERQTQMDELQSYENELVSWLREVKTSMRSQ